MGDATGWRTVAAIVKGTSHEASKTDCQDFGLIALLEDTPEMPLLLCVSDGAGSATNSREGAEFACDNFLRFFAEFFASGRQMSEITRSVGETWINQTRDELKELAASNVAEVRDFACTFLGAIISGTSSRFFQVGDGAIVCSDERDQHSWVAWPEQAEYTNVTYFLTQDDAEAHLQFESCDSEVVEVALFSDGLQRLALQMATKSVHDPFFRHLFGRLRTEPPGASTGMRDALIQFLSSPEILSRTDDDKTLVLATRLAPLTASPTDEDGPN